jgi:hypothetical protein
MPATAALSPKQQLQLWFQWLQSLQIACESASELPATDTLAVFANSTISNVLTDDLQINTFLTTLNGQTPYSFNEALVKQSSTFESLLEKASTLVPILLFANYLESCLTSPYATMSLEDLSSTLLSAVFPTGNTDLAWTVLQSGLTSSIPASCYSAAQQATVTKLLTDATNTVNTMLTQLIKLG